MTTSLNTSFSRLSTRSVKHQNKNEKQGQSNTGVTGHEAEVLSISFDKISSISADDQKAYLELFQKYSQQVVTDKTPERMFEVQKLAVINNKITS